MDNNTSTLRRLYSHGIIDSSPNSFKDFVLENNAPLLIEKLKKGLDDASLKVLNTAVHKALYLPDYKYARYLYVDDSEFKTVFESSSDKMFSELESRYCSEIRKKYKLSKDSYDMEVFVYHHGLRFCSEKIKDYVKNKDFIDGGAYIGDSALVFMDYYPQKVYSFEISNSSIENYKKTMEINRIPNHKFEIIAKAISEKKEQVIVSDYGGMGVKIFNKEGYCIESTDLDSFFENKDVNIGFIKADLEGAMYKALKGMKRIIRKYRPVLSFAIYHSPEEFFYTKPLLDEITKDLNYKITFDCHFSSCFHIYGTIIWAYPLELS